MDRSLPQNSKTAHFPDLNPIENVFHLNSKSPARQAIQKKNITRETFAQLSARAPKTMEEFSVETINIIESRNKHTDMVLKTEVII